MHQVHRQWQPAHMLNSGTAAGARARRACRTSPIIAWGTTRPERTAHPRSHRGACDTGNRCATAVSHRGGLAPALLVSYLSARGRIKILSGTNYPAITPEDGACLARLPGLDKPVRDVLRRARANDCPRINGQGEPAEFVRAGRSS